MCSNSMQLQMFRTAHHWPVGGPSCRILNPFDMKQQTLIGSSFSGVTRYSGLSVHVSCTRPGVSHFSMRLFSFSGKWWIPQPVATSNFNHMVLGNTTTSLHEFTECSEACPVCMDT